MTKFGNMAWGYCSRGEGVASGGDYLGVSVLRAFVLGLMSVHLATWQHRKDKHVSRGSANRNLLLLFSEFSDSVVCQKLLQEG